MKTILEKIISCVLAFVITLSGLLSTLMANDVFAATRSDLNSIDCYLKQPNGSDTCTLYANMMMLRRNAIVHNDGTWTGITEASCRPNLWSEAYGMPCEYNHYTSGGTHAHVFCYANDSNSETGTTASFRTQDGNTKRTMIRNLLSRHPEGVVVYDWDKPHAILVTDYTNGIFYVADSNPGYPRGRIPESQASVFVQNCESYYVVTNPGTLSNQGSSSGGGSGASLPGTKVTPADDFYAYILRKDVWAKVGASSTNNVEITKSSNSETDSSCIWRFENTGKGNFLIYNGNGKVLDAVGDGDGQTWKNVVITDYHASNSQLWNLYETGNGYMIKSAYYDNLVFDCADNAKTPGTNIQLINVNRNCYEAETFSVYIIAKRCDLTSESGEAYLIRKSPWLHLENSSNGNVQIAANGNDSLDPKQVFKYQRQADYSYTFNTMYTSSDVSVSLAAASNTSNGANVYTGLSSSIGDVKNCHWYVYRLQQEYGGALILRIKGREQVLNTGSSAAGSNVNVSCFTNTVGQKFDIWNLSLDKRTYARPGTPNAPTLTSPTSATVGQNISLSWTASPLKSSEFDKRAYNVEILSGNNVIQKTTTTALTATIKIDTEGTYSIRIRAVNTKYPGDSISSVSTAKTIVVSPAVKTLTSSMVSSVVDQEYTGSAVTPAVTVKDGSAVLKEGTDYTVAYSNNVNVGEATATITGKGNYTGTVTVKYNIVKATYKITLGSVKNGTVSLSKTTAYAGDEITITAEPNPGFELFFMSVNGEPISGNKFTMPAKNAVVYVMFTEQEFRITTRTIGNGTVVLSKTKARAGEEITVTATPDSGYILDSVKVNGTAISEKTFTMPDKDTTIEVIFKATAHAIVFAKVSNGTAKLSKTSANAGEEITVTVNPDDGYVLDKIKVNNAVISGNKFTMPDDDIVIVAVTFKKAEYAVSVSKTGEGTVTVSKTSANLGDKITVTATPESGYALGSIKVNGTAISGNTFDMPAQDTKVEVTFDKITYTISVKKNGEGTVKLSKTSANSGDKITVTATPADGYEISSIKVNDSEIAGNKFTMPAKNTTVVVTFAKIAVSHELTKISAKSATCTEDGNTAYYVCKDTDCGCGKFFNDKYGQKEIDIKDTVVPATGHSLEKVAAKSATCTEKGHLAYWKCTKCGKLFKDSDGKNEITADNVEVDALGHDKDNLKHVKAKAETYKVDGNIEYYVCPGCGKKFADPDCKKELTDTEIIIPKKGAAELGETATVDGLKYRVTDPSTDGTGTVTLIGAETKTANVVIPTSVEIKESIYLVDRIAAKAFYKDTTLKSVYIGVNTRFIDSSAFYGCKNLVKVSGGAKLETIAASAFAYCSKLKTFVITSPVLRQIGSCAFNKDKKLKTVYIKNTVKLTKAGVKSSLKGSSVKTVKVKKAKVKAYKKFFKKSNSGRSVAVKK